MQTSSLKIGTILKSSTQEYKIDKILGAGSFGITYLATSKVKHGNVTFTVKFAIKEHFMESCFRDTNGVFVHCTPTSQKNVELSRKDFLNEARRLQEICKYSNNIVHVNEAFEANGTAYYVMEYLDGGSPKQTDEKSAIEIIQQVAEAVSILHKNKLLHLDIKPDNIVLKSSENGETYPVLIDFGITKHFDEKGNPTSSPNAKGISQGYAPIEQNDVIREFAPTLDIYALGATLLYLLTGKNPPSSVKLIDPSQRELRSLLPSNVSPETRNAILKAMSPNKNDRPQSVKAFLNDLNCNNWNSSNKQENQTSKTKPIKKGTRSHTEPIKKKKKQPDDSKAPKRWNVSYWATMIALIISSLSLWLVYPNIFYTGIIYLAGLAIDLGLCYYLSKRTKKNSGLVFAVTLCVFLIICYVFKLFLPLYIVIAEIALIPLLLLAFVEEKNNTRWCLSASLLVTTCFLGYRWYSQNILHNQYLDSDDTDSIRQEEIIDPEVTGDENEVTRTIEHEFVDLGLPSGLKWAKYNLGESPVLGDLYAYSELIPDSGKPLNTDYLRNKHIIDSSFNLTSEYDVVTSQWGTSWRTPTIVELIELFENCEIEYGKNPHSPWDWWLTGPSGASIHLPRIIGCETHYLSSTVHPKTECYMICLNDSVYKKISKPLNGIGLVRPVLIEP